MLSCGGFHVSCTQMLGSHIVSSGSLIALVENEEESEGKKKVQNPRLFA